MFSSKLTNVPDFQLFPLERRQLLHRVRDMLDALVLSPTLTRCHHCLRSHPFAIEEQVYVTDLPWTTNGLVSNLEEIKLFVYCISKFVDSLNPDNNDVAPPQTVTRSPPQMIRSELSH
jgi:hypothetical protein